MLDWIFKKNKAASSNRPAGAVAPSATLRATPIAAPVSAADPWPPKLQAALGDDTALLALLRESAPVDVKMAAVNGAEDALDTADEVAEHMQRDELEVATQVLGQIFRKYLMELQSADGRSPFSPLP